MNKIKISCNGAIYAGEHNADLLFLENFEPQDGAEYYMRFVSTDGQTYVERIYDSGVKIRQSLIPTEGTLQAEVCEKIGEDYVSLSGIYLFPVNKSITETEETPTTPETAKTLAERAIEAAEKAEQHKLDGKSAYELAVENGFVGTEPEWIASLKGEQGDEGKTGKTGDPMTWEKMTDSQKETLKTEVAEKAAELIDMNLLEAIGSGVIE